MQEDCGDSLERYIRARWPYLQDIFAPCPCKEAGFCSHANDLAGSPSGSGNVTPGHDSGDIEVQEADSVYIPSRPPVVEPNHVEGRSPSRASHASTHTRRSENRNSSLHPRSDRASVTSPGQNSRRDHSVSTAPSSRTSSRRSESRSTAPHEGHRTPSRGHSNRQLSPSPESSIRSAHSPSTASRTTTSKRHSNSRSTPSHLNFSPPIPEHRQQHPQSPDLEAGEGGLYTPSRASHSARGSRRPNKAGSRMSTLSEAEAGILPHGDRRGRSRVSTRSDFRGRGRADGESGDRSRSVAISEVNEDDARSDGRGMTTMASAGSWRDSRQGGGAPRWVGSNQHLLGRGRDVGDSRSV